MYERVSGETLPVTDPARLDALYRGGQQARGRAEHFANRAAHRSLDAPTWKNDRSVGIAFALSSVARQTDDIASQLFVESFRDALGQALEQFVRIADPSRGYPADHGRSLQEQDALSMFAHYLQGSTVDPGGRRPCSTWHIQATWDGAIAAGAALSPQAVEELTKWSEFVRPAWEVVMPLIRRLGGYGTAHLSIAVYVAQDGAPKTIPLKIGAIMIEPPPPPPKGSLFSRMPKNTLIGRTTTVADPDPDLMAACCARASPRERAIGLGARTRIRRGQAARSRSKGIGDLRARS